MKQNLNNPPTQIVAFNRAIQRLFPIPTLPELRAQQSAVQEILELAHGVAAVMSRRLDINIYFFGKEWGLINPAIWEPRLITFTRHEYIFGIRFGNIKESQENILQFAQHELKPLRDLAWHERIKPFPKQISEDATIPEYLLNDQTGEMITFPALHDIPS